MLRHFIAWKVIKQPKHDFVNTFIKNSQKVEFYKSISSIKNANFVKNVCMPIKTTPTYTFSSLKLFLDPKKSKSPMTLWKFEEKNK